MKGRDELKVTECGPVKGEQRKREKETRYSEVQEGYF